MQQTPFPLGAPTDFADETLLGFSDGAVAAPSRASGAWQDISWVGFADDDEMPAVASSTPAQDLAAIPAAASEIEHPAPALRVDPGDAWADFPAHVPDAVIGDHRPRPTRRFAAAVKQAAAQRLRSFRSAIRRLFGLAIAAATMGAVAVFAYQGGARLAELVGPAASGNAPAHPAIALAAPEADRASSAPAAAAAEHLVRPKGRAALYLDRAKAGDAAAQYNLAVLYVRADGVARDLAQAARWFREAAAAGNVDAQFNLAVMYERGLGVEQNPAEAVRWYERAAARNHASAQYNLGLAYAEGRGVSRDPTMAALWYRQAAAQRLLPAMLNLAILYDKGEGVGRSLVDAYAWYRAAARGGDAVAAKRAQEVFDWLPGTEKGKAVIAAAAVVEIVDKPPSVPPPVAGNAVPGGETGAAASPAQPMRDKLAGQPEG